MVINLKKHLLYALQSSAISYPSVNFDKNKPVLILGDGSSLISAIGMLPQYGNNLITCNSVLLNNSVNKSPLANINISKNIFLPRIFTSFANYQRNKLFQDMVQKFPLCQFIFHSTARLLAPELTLNSRNNVCFLSPHASIKINNGFSYNYLDSALQCSIGIALFYGFTEIHLAGFDGWLLTPRSNLRWYSTGKLNLTPSEDLELPAFLRSALEKACIKVLTTRSQRSCFNEILPLPTPHELEVTDEADNSHFLDSKSLKIIRDWELSLYSGQYLG